MRTDLWYIKDFNFKINLKKINKKVTIPGAFSSSKDDIKAGEKKEIVDSSMTTKTITNEK